MRTFIAISLPKEIKDRLAKLQTQLKASGADVKWVHPDNIHLTLKFLGEIDDKTQNKISRIIEEVAKTKTSFPISLFSLGAFPKISSPRVIWVGIKDGDPEAKEIAILLEEEIARLGIPKEEKPFTAHITIGRTKSSKNLRELTLELQKLQEELRKKNLRFIADKISLYESTLTQKGPIYEILKQANLRAA